MDADDRFKVLVEQLATVLRVQEVTARVLKNKPSHVLLVKFKKRLARETKKLLLLEREIHLSRSVDGNWESNSSEFFDESFELIGSVLKKVTLIEKEIDETVEGSPIDSNSEENVVHNSSDEGNYSSQPKYDFSIVNGAGVTHVQDYKSHTVNLVSPYSALQGKVETQFLDYQEGKPFLPGTDFVVDFPSKRAATHEVFSGQHVSPIILPFDSTRALFDRGKYKLKFVSKLRFPYCFGFQFFDRLCSESVQKLVSDIGYQSDGFPSDSIVCMLANDGFTTTVWCMFDKMLECAVMRRLIDRGKQFAVVPRLYFVTHMLHITFLLDISSITENTRLTFDRGREFYDGSVSVNTYHTDFICTLILGLKCGFKWVLTDSNVFEIVQDTDDYCDNELNVKISQATSLFRSISTSLWFSMAESEMNWEFSDRMHNYRRCCFSGAIVSIRIQLGYCSRKIPDSVTRSWNSEEGLYCGLECTGRGQKGFPDTLEVILLCQRFTNHSHEIRNTLQDKDNSTQGFQYGIVFHSYTHSLASCRHWLGVHSRSEYFGRIPVDSSAEDRVSQAVKHPNLSFMSTSNIAQYLNPCFHQAVGVFISHSTRYFLPCNCYLWGWIYETTKSSSWFRIFARFVRTQFLLTAIQILTVIMLLEFLRWKFKLLSTSLRTMRNCSGLNWVVIVLLGLHSFTVYSSSKWSFSWVETHGLGEYLREFLFLRRSYSCVTPKMCAKMFQQGTLLWTKLKIQKDIVKFKSTSTEQHKHESWCLENSLEGAYVYPGVSYFNSCSGERSSFSFRTPAVYEYESFIFRDRVLITVVGSTWSCLYSFYCAQHRSSGCNQLMIVCIHVFLLNILSCVTSGELYDRPSRILSLLIVHWQGYIVRIPSILSCIPNVLMSVDFLQWKFEFPTGPWGVGTVNEDISVLVVVVYMLLEVFDTKKSRMWVLQVTTTGAVSTIRSTCKRGAITMLITLTRQVIMQPRGDTDFFSKPATTRPKGGVFYDGPLQVKKKMSTLILPYNLIGTQTMGNACRCLPYCSQLLGFAVRHKWRSKDALFCRWVAELSLLPQRLMGVILNFLSKVCIFQMEYQSATESSWTEMKTHKNLDYIDVFSSSAHVHTTVLDEIMSISKNQAVRLLRTVLASLVMSKFEACANKGLWLLRDCTSKVLFSFNSQILEQLDNHKGKLQLQAQATGTNGVLYGQYFYMGRMPNMLAVRQMPKVLTVLTVDPCLSLLGLEMWCSGPRITVLVSAFSHASLQPSS